jgi:predicted RNase H-like HicB family nuclease
VTKQALSGETSQSGHGEVPIDWRVKCIVTKSFCSGARKTTAFVADVPELPGCMAHGDTQESALQNIKEAMSGWIEVAAELGRSIPEAARDD